MKRVRSIRMDDETWELANERARSAGLSVSDYLRGLIQSQPHQPRSINVNEQFRSRPFTPVPKKEKR